jgi:hypothetical protein
MLLRRSEGAEVRVTAIKHNASQHDLDKVLVDLQRQDDRLVGKVHYLAEFSSVAVNFVVDLPPGIAVELESSSGNITLENVDGEVHADTGSGYIRAVYTQPLRQIGSDADLSKHNGMYRVTRNSHGGNIIIRRRDGEGAHSSPRTLTTGSGNITLRLSDRVRADVLIESLSSPFEATSPDVEELGAGRFLKRVNGGGPLIEVSTGSGKFAVNRI